MNPFWTGSTMRAHSRIIVSLVLKQCRGRKGFQPRAKARLIALAGWYGYGLDITYLLQSAQRYLNLVSFLAISLGNGVFLGRGNRRIRAVVLGILSEDHIDMACPEDAGEEILSCLRQLDARRLAGVLQEQARFPWAQSTG